MDRASIFNKKRLRLLDRFETKIILIIILTAFLSAALVFIIFFRERKKAEIISLKHTAESIFQYASEYITSESFFEISSPENIDLPIYGQIQRRLNNIRKIAGLRYLYTIKRDGEGRPVYHIDGLVSDANDICFPGELIESAILDDVENALDGSIVLAEELKKTEYGYIYASYWPYKDERGNVIGAVGMEYDATMLIEQEKRIMLRCIVSLFIIIPALCLLFSVLFKGITRPFHKQLAYLDILTGLNNRTAFELDKRKINSDLQKYPGISMIMFDLNNLKEVNDSFGHHKGDSYITLAAQIIEKHFGPFGIAYRIGGDEFCVISIGNDGKAFSQLLETNFCNDVKAHKDYIKDNDGRGYFAIAYGIASFDKNLHRDIHDVFNTADERMYLKKKQMKENC